MYKGAEEYCDEPKDTRKYFAECFYCHEEIYKGEPYYEFMGDCYHEDCFKDDAVEILKEAGATYNIAGQERLTILLERIE